MKKQKLYIVGVILAMFIVTNPSQNDFMSYRHYPPTFWRVYLGRDANFFLFSIYSETAKGTYIGILGNFFRL